MRVQSFAGLIVLVCSLAMAAAPALAQPTADPTPLPSNGAVVEVTPFVSMGTTRSSRIGTALTFPVTQTIAVETEVGYRRGEGDINALSSSVNLLYSLPRIGRVAPYLAAGAGLEEQGEPLVQPDGRVATQSKLQLALNAGGGLKVPVDDRWSLRTDARWFWTTGRYPAEHFRVYQGASIGVGSR
jgi:opacity protein-like surface antigen